MHATAVGTQGDLLTPMITHVNEQDRVQIERLDRGAQSECAVGLL